MTATDQLTRARDHLSEAFAELEATTGLPEMEAHAVVELRADVSETIRRLGNLLVFAERAER